MLVWVFLKNDSIKMFFEKCLSVFFKGGKDALYSTMRDEEINWRQISLATAKEIYVQNDLAYDKETALIFDDTIKQRSGKKVEGISSHFEHTEGRNVMGHQILELGFAFKDGFIPLDRQIYVGETRTHLLNGKFKNSKSAVAKDFECAVSMDKNEMFRTMLRRAIRNGINAKYCLADSWFVNKKNIKAVKKEGITGIFRMKRGNLKYLFAGKMYSLEVYFKEIKQNMGFLKEQSWSYVSHYASIHLDAIRYMLPFDILLLSGNSCSFAESRNKLTGKLEMLTFAAMLWELFKAIIYGALDSFEKLIGSEMLKKIKDKISSTIEMFLEKALQLDEAYIKNELKAERIGALI